jgi:hypothetical protein
MSFTIVTSTYNIKSHENLFSSLHTWINLDFNEFIIIDWCSDIKFEEVLPSYFKTHKNFDKIKIYYIRNYDKYIPTWAYNFGISLSNSEYILKIDPNFSLNSDFFKINNFMNDQPCLYFDQHQFLCKKIYLEKVDYLNEKILNDNYMTDLIVKLKKEYNYSYTFLIKDLHGLNNILDTEEIIILPIKYNKENDIYNINSVSCKFKPNLSLEKRFIVLKVYNGIGNRIKTLLTTIHFAQKYNYKLYVIWEKTPGFSDSKFNDYFIYKITDDFQFISSNDIENINFEYKYFFKQDNKNVQNFDLTYNRIYIESYYKIAILFSMEKPSKNINNEEKVLYKNIKPSIKVQIIIDYIKKYILTSDDKYNIYHIRRGDATNPMNKNRNKTYIWSSIYMFAKYINMHSEKQNLVLTDDYNYCKKFLDVICPHKYTTVNETNLNKDVLHTESKIFTIQDVVDLFLFENAEKVYETYWSTFSDTGIHMFDIKDSHTVVDKNLYLEIKYDNSTHNLQNDIVSNYIPYCTFFCNYNNLEEYIKSSNYSYNVIVFDEVCDKYINLKNFQNKINLIILKNCIKNSLHTLKEGLENMEINILQDNKIDDNYNEIEKYIISTIYNRLYL